MDLFYLTERSRNRGETTSVFTALKTHNHPIKTGHSGSVIAMISAW